MGGNDIEHFSEKELILNYKKNYFKSRTKEKQCNKDRQKTRCFTIDLCIIKKQIRCYSTLFVIRKIHTEITVRNHWLLIRKTEVKKAGNTKGW